METGRRFFLSGIAVMLAGTRALLAGSQRPAPPPRFPQTPDASGSNRSQDDIPAPPRADPKVQLQESQKNLRRDIDRLLQLAKDLKDEADKTQETDVLSLSLVKKAEEIEKLARQIKDLIRTT